MANKKNDGEWQHSSKLTTIIGAVMASVFTGLDDEAIAAFLLNEHPKLIAAILARLDAGQSGKILMNLPPDARAEVIVYIAEGDKFFFETIAVLELARQQLSTLDELLYHRVDGPKKVAEIFSHIDQSREKQILDRLDLLKPSLAQVIRKHLFSFNDVFNLDPRSIQLILREISNDVLTLAIKTANDDVREKVYANISPRAATMIREDLETMGPVRLAVVEQAQAEIFNVIRRLEAEGKIVVGRNSDTVLC